MVSQAQEVLTNLLSGSGIEITLEIRLLQCINPSFYTPVVDSVMEMQYWRINFSRTMNL